MLSPRLLTAVVLLIFATWVRAEEPLDLAALEQQKQTELLKSMSKQGTHLSVAEVNVVGTDGKTKLQTICADADGRVLALVAPPRVYGGPLKAGASEVHVYSPDGKPVAHWAVPFHANSINVGPDGHVYVAGDAKVVQFDKTGKSLGEPIELPHIASMIKNESALRKQAKNELKQEGERVAQTLQIHKQFEEMVKKLEAKPESQRSKSEIRQLEQAKLLLEQLGEERLTPRTVEQIMESHVARLRVINAIAVSDKDVFVACGELEGYGYGVWRLTRDLKEPKKIVDGLSGCCGQMDIQVLAADLLVAENGKHHFNRYDREGKLIGAYGRGASDPGNGAGSFGGCCNPMNVCAAAGGDVLTAESEGVVKRFSATGEFRGVVGAVPIKGECKNVAIGASADGQHVYFCDQPSSRFFILNRKTDEKKG